MRTPPKTVGWLPSRSSVPLAAAIAAAAVLIFLVPGTAAAKDKKDKKDKKDTYIGVYMQDLTRELRRGLDLDTKRGVLVSGIEEDSPAEEAGLEDGDVIVEFNGKKVDSPDDLRDLVADTKVGDKVKVVVVRDGDKKTIDIIVGERPDSFGWQYFDDGDFDTEYFGDNLRHGLSNVFTSIAGGPRLGVQVTGLNKDLASYFDAKPDEGVLVLEVEDESVAAEAGLKAGDVILEVDGEKVDSASNLRRELRDYDPDDQFDITVLRKGDKKTLKATMTEDYAGGWSNMYFDNGKRIRIHSVPRLRSAPLVEIDRDELRKEMKEMKEELKELKEELKRLKEDKT